MGSEIVGLRCHRFFPEVKSPEFFILFLTKASSYPIFFMGKDQYDNLYLESSLRAASSLGFDGELDLKYQELREGINLIYNEALADKTF